MILQTIVLGDDGWNLIVLYNASLLYKDEIVELLQRADCPSVDIRAALLVLRNKNTGFTYSNVNERISIVCISEATSAEQFMSTVVHESKHVQSHICSYYDINEKGEEAAYLIGYIARRMYKVIRTINFNNNDRIF